MKKVLAAVLAAAMALTLAMPAFAANDNELDVVVDNSATGATVSGTNGADGIRVDGVYTANDQVATGDIVDSRTTLYVVVSAVAPAAGTDLTNDKEWDFSFKKGDNSKVIKSMKLVEKDLTGTADREVAVEIKFNEIMDDTEYKMNPEITVRPRGDVADNNPNMDDTVITVKFFYDNENANTSDEEFAAGTKGVVAKPEKNEDNEVLWVDENKDLAKLEFSADSDTSAYYPKLSTKWANEDYAELIGDMDAFIFDFVGNPTISSTSRPVLTLYNPFYDEDEEALTVAEEDIVVYLVNADGTIDDITAQFTIEENDDGDNVLVTKTRTLGTYIIAERALEGAADAETETPDDGKEIPNTGR